MHHPDFLAIRACLATAKSLDIDTVPVWMLLIAPSSSGKTSYYVRCCEAYPRYQMSDEISMAGVSSANARTWGQGLLNKLGTLGLWLMSDFTVVLNMREERRNELIGIQRRIFDGKYERWANGEKQEWKGRVHVVAGVTPGIERFHRVNSDLGERFLQIRVDRSSSCIDLIRKTDLQRQHWQQFQDEILEGAKLFLDVAPISPFLPLSIARQIMDWADFISLGRVSTDCNYKDEIVNVGHQEGAGRLHQQLSGLAIADAILMGDAEVGPRQLQLIERVAMDCLPWKRRAILSWFRTDEAIIIPEVRNLSGITHPVAFSRAIDELEAIGAIERIGPENRLIDQKVKLVGHVKRLLAH